MKFGKVQQHDYQMYRVMHEIKCTRTKTALARTNGICERFGETTLQEFFHVAFREQLSHSLDELGEDLAI